MKLTLKLILMLPALLAGTGFCGEDRFEQDRKAILAMAGGFKVGFHFQETLSLRGDYQADTKPYDENAFETVKIAEDSGRRIVLQHILLAGPSIVKHWAQIWTYEDTEILEFQGGRVWTTRKLTPEEAKGKWSQRVTQIDDSPRYEGIGEWIHRGEASEWTAAANRPKPRREESRTDYDLLIVTNRHTVTPQGWFHEQDNTKWVKQDGKSYPLCREIGFNPYQRVTGHDFTKADDYWTKTAAFWKDVRQVWDDFSPPDQGSIRILAKADSGRIFEVVEDLVDKAEDGEAPALADIRATLQPFVTAPGKQP